MKDKQPNSTEGSIMHECLPPPKWLVASFIFGMPICIFMLFLL